QPSNGVFPLSLTMDGSALYVLNAMGIGNITGFRVAPDGSLSPIARSTRRLTGPLVNPAEVRFNPQGTVLMVTEKGTTRVDTFPVDAQGHVGRIHVTRSSGLEPFGFSFDPSGDAVVSEGFGAAPGRGAVSSCRVAASGR